MPESEVVLVTLSRLRRSIPLPPKRKKPSGTQGSCKIDIFKLKFDQRSFVWLERIALCIGGIPQKCSKFCQQIVYSQNDTLLVGIPISRRETKVSGIWQEILTRGIKNENKIFTSLR